MPTPDTNRQPVLSVVIPVRCGAGTLQALCAEIEAAAAQMGNLPEIVMVDDASCDGSWSVIQALAAGNSHVLGIRLAENYGQHNATAVGLAHTTGAIVVTMDEDLQHPPAEIRLLLDRMSETGADLVYGTPLKRRQTWWRRQLAAILMPLMTRLVGIHTTVSAFRAMHASVARSVSGIRRSDLILDVHLAQAADRIDQVPFHHAPTHRRSSYRFSSLAAIVLRVILGYAVFSRGWQLAMAVTLLTGGGLLALARTCRTPLTGACCEVLAGLTLAAFAGGFGLFCGGHMFRRHARRQPVGIVAHTTRPADHGQG